VAWLLLLHPVVDLNQKCLDQPKHPSRIFCKERIGAVDEQDHAFFVLGEGNQVIQERYPYLNLRRGCTSRVRRMLQIQFPGDGIGDVQIATFNLPIVRIYTSDTAILRSATTA
jgi:hypothetical protein